MALFFRLRSAIILGGAQVHFLARTDLLTARSKLVVSYHDLPDREVRKQGQGAEPIGGLVRAATRIKRSFWLPFYDSLGEGSWMSYSIPFIYYPGGVRPPFPRLFYCISSRRPLGVHPATLGGVGGMHTTCHHRWYGRSQRGTMTNGRCQRVPKGISGCTTSDWVQW